MVRIGRVVGLTIYKQGLIGRNRYTMRLALVTVEWKTPLSTMVYPPLGIGYIASYLREYSDVRDIVVIDGAMKEDVLERIRLLKPDIIGISSTSLEFSNAIQYGLDIEQRFDVPIIIGGPHISALPHRLPRCFDIGVIGEGEQTMLELMELYEKEGEFDKQKLGEINGIAFHKGDEVAITESRELIEPLDSIPYPALDLYNMEEYYLGERGHLIGGFGRGVSLMTSRGCVYRCVFCGSSQFWRSLRYHSAERVVSEIKHLIEKYRVDCINIFDDLFIFSRKRLEDIVRLIKEDGIHEKVKFVCQVRANLVNNEICKLLKGMGVAHIGFGLETGSEGVLRRLKSGRISVEDGRRALRIAKKFRLHTSSGFMIGSPGETLDDLWSTYGFILGNPLTYALIYITIPLPGTDLWEYAKREGFVSDDMDWNKLNQFYIGEDPIILSKDIPRHDFLAFRSKLDNTVIFTNAINSPKLRDRLRSLTKYLRYQGLGRSLEISKDFMKYHLRTK